jgi:hypothetical protein
LGLEEAQDQQGILLQITNFISELCDLYRNSDDVNAATIVNSPSSPTYRKS